MKKAVCIFIIVVFSFGIYAQEENAENKTDYKWSAKKNDWIKGFFLDVNFLYNYSFIKTKPESVSNNLLIEPALGYDFGRIAARVYGNFGFLITGDVKWSNGIEPISENLDIEIYKFGAELSVKLIKSAKFELLVPIGVLFNWTTFTQKEPVYDYRDGSEYDRKWRYEYINLMSGLLAKINIGNHFSICLPFSIGFPIKKDYIYEEILRNGWVWAETNSSTWSEKSDFDIFEFSAGVGIMGHL